MRREVERFQPRRLKPGDKVMPFKAAGIDGSSVEVNFDANRFEVIGLINERENRETVRHYLEKMGCAPGAQTPLRVAFIPAAVRNEYLFDSTPTTLILNGDGRVKQNLVGRWSEDEAKAAGAALSLAGLTH